MKIRKIALGVLAAVVLAAALGWFSLDKETRGLLAALPTNRDILFWSQAQRDAGFRALDRLPAGSPALSEVPYLLAEVAEPGCLKLLGKFLHHKDPEAVAAAIEALVELADPSAAPMLAPLVRDTRQVQIDDEGEVGHVSIGALAEEAGELLAELEHHERRGNQGPPPPRQGGGGGNKKPRR